MKRLLICLFCLGLLACKTIPTGEGLIESPVNPDSASYMYLSLPQQRGLLDTMLMQKEMQDPALDNILERTDWIRASATVDNEWALHLEGRYPLGKIRIALNSSKEWQQEPGNSYVHTLTGLHLVLADKNQLWVLTPDMPLDLYSYREESLPLSLVFRSEEGAVKALNLHNAGIAPLLQGLELQLYDREDSDSFSLNIRLKSLPGKERALTALAKVFMLSLLGPRAMDARIESSQGEVFFQDMEILAAEWEELYQSILSGE